MNIASEKRTLARVKDFTREAIDAANLAMAASIRRNGLSETFRRRQRVAPQLNFIREEWLNIAFRKTRGYN